MDKHIKTGESVSTVKETISFWTSRCLVCDEVHVISSLADEEAFKAHNTFVNKKHNPCAEIYRQKREKAESTDV